MRCLSRCAQDLAADDMRSSIFRPSTRGSPAIARSEASVPLTGKALDVYIVKWPDLSNLCRRIWSICGERGDSPSTDILDATRKTFNEAKERGRFALLIVC